MSATLTRRIFTYVCSTLGAVAIIMLGIFCLSGNSAAASPANSRPLAYAGFAPEQPTADVLTTHVAKKAATSQLQIYTVQSGDTLSVIAGRFYKKPNCWPVIYNANKQAIAQPDAITAGQRLTIPHTYPAAACHAPPGYVSTASSSISSTPSSVQTPVKQGTPAYASSSSGSYGNIDPSSGPGGSFGTCVVTRESSGNSQVMNSSGHYGLYQFVESTWVAYGGSAADFGHASVAEQEHVFENALAAGGQSNWSPYDGC